MEILFKKRKLQKACNSESESVRTWGFQNAKKIRQRLAELTAADTLEQVNKLPPARCHQLDGDRAGKFAVDVVHPFRLIFESAHNPVPRNEDGGIALARITKIVILAVEDYHGR